MNLDNVTVGQLKELKEFLGTKETNHENGPWIIGKKYFIRTVTMHLTGVLSSVSHQELVLKDAAWIADSGRLNEFLEDTSKANEVEPFSSPVIVGRGSVVDATEIMSIITKAK